MGARFSALNVLLIIVTLASLMFGAWGLLTNGDETETGNTIGKSVNDEDEKSRDSSADPDSAQQSNSRNDSVNTGDSPKHRPVKPANHPASSNSVNHSNSDFSVSTRSDPTDKGDAKISGKVVTATGAEVAGAFVTVRRSNLTLTPPSFDGGDIQKYRTEVSEFLTRTHKESRTTTTSEAGAFAFSGLDGSLSYDIEVSTETHGNGSADRIAAGDTVTVLLKSTQVLTGKVQTDAGEILSEFTVKVWKTNQTWEQKSQTFTSADGTFRMVCPWARIKVEVNSLGYSQNKAVEVNISEGSAEHIFVVQQAAYLAGTVTDKSGNPVANVKVSTGSGNGMGRRRWNQSNAANSTTTDSLGRYKLETLQVKEHSVTASIGEVSDTQKVELQIGKNQLDFSIDVGSIIRISTTDPQGKPVEVSQIWFQNKDGGWPRPKRMPLKELGLAEYVGLKSGEYTLHITVPGFAAVKKSITVSAGSNELDIQVVKGGVIRGTITGSDGKALKNITVRLRKENEDKSGGWATGKSARTDADGAYSLGPIEPGEWLLEVYGSTGRNIVFTSTLNITSGEMQQDVKVETGATIKVTIVDESGKKLSWGRIRVRGEKPYNGNADASGIATIAFITPGDYTISANASGLASLTTQMYLNNGTTELTLTVKKPNTARVTQVFAGQARKIGIKVGDLIIEYGNVKINNWNHVNVAKKTVKDGVQTQIVIDRDGQLLTFQIKGGMIGIDGEDAVR